MQDEVFSLNLVVNMWSHLKFVYEGPNQTVPNQTMPTQTKACIAKCRQKSIEHEK
jgi:hypothetical protein